MDASELLKGLLLLLSQLISFIAGCGGRRDREDALLLEADDGVVEALRHRRELEAQLTEPLVRHLVRLLPRVHLVRAPGYSQLNNLLIRIFFY